MPYTLAIKFLAADPEEHVQAVLLSHKVHSEINDLAIINNHTQLADLVLRLRKLKTQNVFNIGSI